jgi:hypothetical protein
MTTGRDQQVAERKVPLPAERPVEKMAEDLPGTV